MHQNANLITTSGTFFTIAEEVPVFLTVFNALSDDMPEAELNMSTKGTHGIYALNLSHVTTRQLMEFCAAVYSDLPEPEEAEAEESPEEASEDPQEATEDEGGEEEPEEDEDPAEELSSGPAKKLKRVERTASSAVTVVTD